MIYSGRRMVKSSFIKHGHALAALRIHFAVFGVDLREKIIGAAAHVNDTRTKRKTFHSIALIAGHTTVYKTDAVKRTSKSLI